MAFDRGVQRALLGLSLEALPRGPLNEETTPELDFSGLTFPPDDDEAPEPEPFTWEALAFESDEERVARHNARDRHGGTLTAAQWRALIRAFEGHCAYCGTTPKKLILEHVRPIAFGGRTSQDNVLPACWGCNVDKGLKSLEEWQSSQGWWLAFITRCARAAERISETK